MMKTTEILSKGALNELHLSQLVDQMDPAIGEATSVMGAMATEVIRRSLRGGVLQIGRELSGYVGEQVAIQIVEHQPMIEKAAAETATEVARGEVESVRQAARELGQQLAARIEEASRDAREKAEVIVRDLTGRLEETAKEAQSLALDLSGRLDEAAKETQSIALDLSGRLESATRQTEEIKGELTVRIQDTARQADEAATSLARALENEVEAVETRTLDTARKEFKQQIEEVRDRARRATTQIKERLDRLDLASAQLPELHQALKRELIDAMRGDRQRLIQEIEDLRRGNEELVTRIEILEKPRGIRGLFAWLFGRNKKKRVDKKAISPVEEFEEEERD